MTTQPHNQPFPVGAASLALIGIAVVGMLVMAGVLVAMDRVDQIQPAALAMGACLIGSLIGQLPVWGLASRQADGVAVGFMLAVLVRILATAIGLAALVGLTGEAIQVFAGWAAPAYVLLLGAEVWLIKRYLERRDDWVSLETTPSATTPATEQAL